MDTQTLLNLYDDMGIPTDMAQDQLNTLINHYDNLQNKLTLYRIIYLNDPNDLNKNNIGKHYSENKQDLINNHYDRGSLYGNQQGEYAYLITIETNKTNIDIEKSIENNILYPHEQEITLLNDNPNHIKLMKIKKL